MLPVVVSVSRRLGRGVSYHCVIQSCSSRLEVPLKRRSFSTADDDHQHRDPGLQWTSVVSHPSRDVPGTVDNIPSRSEQIQRLQSKQPFALLVIGGGATGVGCALDAASRGLKVACVERGDFSSETSSRSTKLIWAGIKYLATATASLLSTNLLTHPVATLHEFASELRMVRSCHVERRYMTEQQPHLCRWIPLAVPMTSWHVSPAPLGHALFGFFPILAPFVFQFYDALSAFACPHSYVLSKNKAAEALPTLKTDSLKYCSVFYEAQHNDSRTCLSIGMTAAQQGATMSNYVEVVDLLRDSSGKVTGARVVDRMTGSEFDVVANKVLMAGGPFTDSIRRMEGSDASTVTKPAVQGASGTHIVLPGSYLGDADMGLLDVNTSDGRFLFILPWQGHTLVGTTDRVGPAETSPRPLEEEIEWLLKESQTYLTGPSFERSDVLSAWRGWRPLAVDPHAAPDAPVSRDHVLSENPETGVVFIAGGKWTTWREMAEEAIDLVVRDGDSKKCSTLELPLYGYEGYSTHLADKLMDQHGLSQDIAEHLVETYGGHAEQVLQLQAQSSHMDDMRLVDGFPYITAEVRFACREYACTVEDVLSRRTRLAFLNQPAALTAIPRVAEIMGDELGWSDEIKEQQMEAARHYIGSYGGPIIPHDEHELDESGSTSRPESKDGFPSAVA